MKKLSIILLLCLFYFEESLSRQNITEPIKPVLSLKECLTKAEQNSKAKEIESLNMELSSNQSLQMKKSMWPVVNGSVSAFYLGDGLTELLPEYGLFATVTASQVLYAGGKIKAGQDASIVKEAISSVRHKQACDALKLSVTRLYWQIVSCERKRKMLLSYLDYYAKAADDVKNQYNEGLVFQNDVLKVKIQLMDCKLQLSKAGQLVKNLYRELGNEIGMLDEYTVADTAINISIPSLVESRPNLSYEEILQHSNTLLLQIEKRITSADRKPIIAAKIGGYSLINQGQSMFNKLASSPMTSFFGLISISIPLFNNSATLRSKECEIKVFQQYLNEQLIKERKDLSFIKAKENMANAWEKTKLSEEIVIQAKEHLRITTDRYNESSVKLIDLLEANILLQKAESELLDQQCELKIAAALFDLEAGPANLF